MNLLKDATLAVEPRLGVPYSGVFFAGENSRISRFCGDSRKSSSKQFAKVFSLERNLLYIITVVRESSQVTPNNCSLVQA